MKELVSTGWMKNWFAVEEKSWGVFTAFVVTVCFPIQLNEPSACPHRASCSSPWLFLFSSCTEVPKTGPTIPGGVNLSSLNSLWTQKPKFPWAWPRPWPLLSWWEAGEKQWELLLFLGKLNSLLQIRWQRFVCLPGNISAWELVFVVTALEQIHPSQ